MIISLNRINQEISATETSWDGAVFLGCGAV
jgi:hypothetical protein